MPSPVGFSAELPAYTRLPVDAVGGDGCEIWSSDGRRWLDLYGGHAVATLGYGRTAVSEAIADQAQRLIFQTNAVESPIRREAIAALVDALPAGLDSVFLVNSGAEAIENALRLAFLATGRGRVCAVLGSFHGRTAAAAAITDHSAAWYGFPNAPFAVDWVDPSDPATLDQIGKDTAAFIVEPVQGVAGAVDLPTEFLQECSERCRQSGALFIADEIQTGIGRTGTILAIEQAGVRPDIITLAKALGSGFPLGAVAVRGELAEVVRPGTLGTTFGGGPMACAAMLATLRTVTAPGFLERVRLVSEVLVAACRTPGVVKITGRGLMVGLHLAQPAKPVRMELLERGFLTGDAKDPQVIRLLPPLILSETEALSFANALSEVLTA